jgi:hypothetical protein
MSIGSSVRACLLAAVLLASAAAAAGKLECRVGGKDLSAIPFSTVETLWMNAAAQTEGTDIWGLSLCERTRNEPNAAGPGCGAEGKPPPKAFATRWTKAEAPGPGCSYSFPALHGWEHSAAGNASTWTAALTAKPRLAWSSATAHIALECCRTYPCGAGGALAQVPNTQTNVTVALDGHVVTHMRLSSSLLC